MPEPLSSPPITLTEMINEVEREIVDRMRLYQRWIDAGQMDQRKADRLIEIMRAVAAELRKVRFDAL